MYKTFRLGDDGTYSFVLVKAFGGGKTDWTIWRHPIEGNAVGVGERVYSFEAESDEDAIAEARRWLAEEYRG